MELRETGERQLVKRRFPTRRSASLTPPLIYYLIGDTPAIVDITSWPPTVVSPRSRIEILSVDLARADPFFTTRRG